MAVDEKAKRELILQMWSQNVSEEVIAKIMKMSLKQVHNLIYEKHVSLSAVTNEEELVQGLWLQGKTEDEIAAILAIDLWVVAEYLEGFV